MKGSAIIILLLAIGCFRCWGAKEDDFCAELLRVVESQKNEFRELGEKNRWRLSDCEVWETDQVLKEGKAEVYKPNDGRVYWRLCFVAAEGRAGAKARFSALASRIEACCGPAESYSRNGLPRSSWKIGAVEVSLFVAHRGEAKYAMSLTIE